MAAIAIKVGSDQRCILIKRVECPSAFTHRIIQVSDPILFGQTLIKYVVLDVKFLCQKAILAQPGSGAGGRPSISRPSAT